MQRARLVTFGSHKKQACSFTHIGGPLTPRSHVVAIHSAPSWSGPTIMIVWVARNALRTFLDTLVTDFAVQ